MNYRHAFHAGNFADVVKHAALALSIEHLKLKPAPFRVIDTHAGAGSYDLTGDEAQRTGEWRDGIGRLIGPDAAPLPAPIERLLKPYLEAIRSLNPDGGLARYPGSPRLALALLRADDRLIANELHPEDAKRLEAEIGRDPRAKVLAIDGWVALKSLLPPKERRGIILVDPPFEEAGEMERLAAGLSETARRFATGTVLLWLPVKAPGEVARLKAALAAKPYPKLIYAGLAVRTPAPDRKLSATGLVVLNPAYRLADQLRELLPFLAERLGQGPGASFEIADLSRP